MFLCSMYRDGISGSDSNRAKTQGTSSYAAGVAGISMRMVEDVDVR